MAPLLYNVAVVEHHNLVCVLHGGHTLADDNARPLDIGRAQFLNNLCRRLHINAGQRIIQQQYLGVTYKGTRNGRALLLPAREGGTALTNQTLYPFGQLRQIVGEARLFDGAIDARFGRVGYAEGNVIA